MQSVHGDLRSRAQHLFDRVRAGDDAFVDGALFVRARAREHEVDDLVFRARVTYADAQPPESIALRRDDVAQAIVSAVAASFLEPYRAARQIDFIVRDQHLRRRELVKIEHARHGPAAAIHESHRFDQPDFIAADAHAR